MDPEYDLFFPDAPDDEGAVLGWLSLALVAALTGLLGWAVWRWVR